MVVSLKVKLNVINAVEALVGNDNSVRLKLPGVLWQGWYKAPLYSSNSQGDLFDEWSYVHGIVGEWSEGGRAIGEGIIGTLRSPRPVSLAELEVLRDELADVLREESLADAEYKQKEQAFKDANDRLIKEREGIKELRKLSEADARNTALRLFAVNGGVEKKLTEGVSAEYFTATAPYEVRLRSRGRFRTPLGF